MNETEELQQEITTDEFDKLDKERELEWVDNEPYYNGVKLILMDKK